MSETLKSWAYWKLLDKNAHEDDKEMARDIEAMLRENAALRELEAVCRNGQRENWGGFTNESSDCTDAVNVALAKLDVMRSGEKREPWPVGYNREECCCYRSPSANCPLHGDQILKTTKASEEE